MIVQILDETDPVRRYSELFRRTSQSIRNKFTYESPSTTAELIKIIATVKPDIVVIDGHGRYDQTNDVVHLLVGKQWVNFDTLLSSPPIAPLWIISACDMAVSEAFRGCAARSLLSRGAYAVIATLDRVDAFIASILVGRLLTEVYQPGNPTEGRTLADAFFLTQVTTALLYDPLLPLFRQSEIDPAIKPALGLALAGILSWGNAQRMELEEYRHGFAERIAYGAAKT